ncbi:hypothetical protein GCM10027024_16780 [Microbacterium insulae]
MSPDARPAQPADGKVERVSRLQSPLRSRPAPVHLTRTLLTRGGMTRTDLDHAIADGTLVRARRDRYLRGAEHPDVVHAARLGGRLDCVSLLRHLGVFVLETTPLHVQIDVGASRIPPRTEGVRYHWRRSSVRRDALYADRIEALAEAVRCQGPREAIATLDSALHLGFIEDTELGLVFERLPRRYGVLRGLIDVRCESGTESLMRLVLRTLGCVVDVQVVIRGVGRVDFVVDGWLIIECDSEAFHSSWEQVKRDKRRDLAAAALGYTTVRVIAEDIFFRRDEVRAALQSALLHGPRGGRRPSRRTNSSISARNRASRPQTTPKTKGDEELVHAERAAVRRRSPRR